MNEYHLVYEAPSRGEAGDAVKALLRWAGENPNRQGVLYALASV